jgi:phosphoribosylglycinamide formyltransferase-1
LVSGSGSNLQAILDAIESDPGFGVAISVVLSDRAGVTALQRAERAGVPTKIVEWGDHSGRATFTAAVCDVIEASEAHLVVLAGFMRILGPEAIARFPNRIINIHPSLLPAFPGRHAVRDTLAEGAEVTGVTIHVVDEHVDHGPIIAQESVPVLAGDSEGSLHARIQAVEHRLYPATIKAIASGSIDVGGLT